MAIMCAVKDAVERQEQPAFVSPLRKEEARRCRVPCEVVSKRWSDYPGCGVYRSEKISSNVTDERTTRKVEGTAQREADAAERSPDAFSQSAPQEVERGLLRRDGSWERSDVVWRCK